MLEKAVERAMTDIIGKGPKQIHIAGQRDNISRKSGDCRKRSENRVHAKTDTKGKGEAKQDRHQRPYQANFVLHSGLGTIEYKHCPHLRSLIDNTVESLLESGQTEPFKSKNAYATQSGRGQAHNRVLHALSKLQLSIIGVRDRRAIARATVTPQEILPAGCVVELSTFPMLCTHSSNIGQRRRAAQHPKGAAVATQKASLHWSSTIDQPMKAYPSALWLVVVNRRHRAVALRPQHRVEVLTGELDESHRRGTRWWLALSHRRHISKKAKTDHYPTEPGCWDSPRSQYQNSTCHLEKHFITAKIHGQSKLRCASIRSPSKSLEPSTTLLLFAVDFPFEELERHGVPSAFESWTGRQITEHDIRDAMANFGNLEDRPGRG
ncbi:hypothetical protein BS47DRAFT_1388655 [Hydnum rufescens UP504]|uniref:Uncharacterized protein n=1 Tax=Hydnum rufescens UP504 TaxID=1448309 RepID=A0A9P6B7S3_9AGAM|nr:hypothetical protein BS47DRAFT_1388655 [Hydnum rufescens UP504]